MLFAAWGIETILWVATTVHSVTNGDVISAVTAAGALALLVLLGPMRVSKMAGRHLRVDEYATATWLRLGEQLQCGTTLVSQLHIRLHEHISRQIDRRMRCHCVHGDRANVLNSA